MNFNKDKSMLKREQNNLHVHSKHNNAMQCNTSRSSTSLKHNNASITITMQCNAMQCKQSKHELQA